MSQYVKALGPCISKHFLSCFLEGPPSTQSSVLVPDNHSGKGSSLHYLDPVLFPKSRSWLWLQLSTCKETVLHRGGHPSLWLSEGQRCLLQAENQHARANDNGQCARISDWAQCSSRELGLVEDVATALSFSTMLPPPTPRPQGHGSASGHGGWGRRLTRQHGPKLKKFPSPKAGASDWVFVLQPLGLTACKGGATSDTRARVWGQCCPETRLHLTDG